MTKMYEGDKPCPCCGKPGVEEPRLRVDDICSQCKDIHKAGLIAIANAKSDSTVYVYANFFPPLAGDLNACDKVFRAFCDLLKSFDNKNAVYTKTEYCGSHRSGGVKMIIPEHVFKKAQHLYNQLVSGLNISEEKGQKMGQGLLTQLASGKITLADFDRQSV